MTSCCPSCLGCLVRLLVAFFLRPHRQRDLAELVQVATANHAAAAPRHSAERQLPGAMECRRNLAKGRQHPCLRGPRRDGQHLQVVTLYAVTELPSVDTLVTDGHLARSILLPCHNPVPSQVSA